MPNVCITTNRCWSLIIKFQGRSWPENWLKYHRWWWIKCQTNSGVCNINISCRHNPHVWNANLRKYKNEFTILEWKYLFYMFVDIWTFWFAHCVIKKWVGLHKTMKKTEFDMHACLLCGISEFDLLLLETCLSKFDFHACLNLIADH